MHVMDNSTVLGAVIWAAFINFESLLLQRTFQPMLHFDMGKMTSAYNSSWPANCLGFPLGFCLLFADEIMWSLVVRC